MGVTGDEEFDGIVGGVETVVSGSIRAAAISMKELFDSLVSEGFTEDQATSLIAKLTAEKGRIEDEDDTAP